MVTVKNSVATGDSMYHTSKSVVFILFTNSWMPAKNSSADEDDDRWSTPIKHEQSLLTLQPALFLLKKPSNDLLLYYLRNCDENYFRIFKVKFKSFDIFSTSYILNTCFDPW